MSAQPAPKTDDFDLELGIWRASRARPAFWLRAIVSLGLWVLFVWRQNYIRVTPQTVTQRRGNLLSGNETTIQVTSVTDITLNQSALGSLFNYGDVTIQSAGSGEKEIMFNGLADPRRLRSMLIDLRDGRLDRTH